MELFNDDILRHIAEVLPNVTLIPFSRVCRRFNDACIGLPIRRSHFMQECFSHTYFELFKWGYSQHFLMLRIFVEDIILPHNDDATILQFVDFLQSIGFSIWLSKGDEDAMMDMFEGRFMLAKALHTRRCLFGNDFARIAASTGNTVDAVQVVNNAELRKSCDRPDLDLLDNCLYWAAKYGQFNSAQVIMLGHFAAREFYRYPLTESAIASLRACVGKYNGIVRIFVVYSLDSEIRSACDICITLEFFDLLHLIGRMYRSDNISVYKEEQDIIRSSSCMRKNNFFPPGHPVREYMERLDACICCGDVPVRSPKFRRIDSTD